MSCWRRRPCEPTAHVVPFDSHAAGQEEIDEQAILVVEAHARIVGGDDGVRPHPVDDLIRRHVGGEQIVHGDGRVPESPQPPWREHPEQPCSDGQDVDLVDGHPVAYQGAEGVDGDFGPAPEAIRGVRAQPEVVAQPVRMGEVVQRDQRLEPAFDTTRHDGLVTLQGRPVHPDRIGDDPGPLDTQAEAVAAQFGRPVQRLLRPLPEADGVPRRLDPAHRLPAEPVVGRLARAVVATLDLEACRGHSQEEPFGESGDIGSGLRRWLANRGQRHHLSKFES